VTLAKIPFKERLRRRELIVGTWIKTPSYIATEVLAGTDLDVLCLDAEHAAFDRVTLDACVLACRANAMPVLVRVPSAAPDQVLNALDIGATGIVVPHVTSGSIAQAIANASLYGPGGRGYAGSSRAAHYTRKAMSEHLADAAAETTIIAQIEDRQAVEDIETIVAIPQIDCLFIGRADLAVAYGVDGPGAAVVVAAAERVCASARKAGKAVGMYLPDVAELPRWRALGASFYLLESDHTFLLRGASTLAARARSDTGTPHGK
jgi:2-keto-3-deoxy-L-rhamnonate aldolase RhmA